MGAKNSGSTHPTKRPIIGVISPVRIYREILVSALSRELEVVTIDLLDGGRRSIDRLSQNPPAVVIVDVVPELLPGLVRMVRRRSRASRRMTIESSRSQRPG